MISWPGLRPVTACRLEKGNYFCGISDLSYCGGGEGPGLDGLRGQLSHVGRTLFHGF